MSDGRKIIEGLRAAVAHARGDERKARVTHVHVPRNIDVRRLRGRLNLSQEEFALRFGFAIGTVRHWEQGRRYPVGHARVLLTVIEHNPQAVDEALAAARTA